MNPVVSTTSELVQSQLPGSRLVKGFNNINYVHLGSLQRPSGSPERSVLAIEPCHPCAPLDLETAIAQQFAR